jgi:hypothetical protein
MNTMTGCPRTVEPITTRGTVAALRIYSALMAIAAILIITFAVKMFLFSAPTAEADTRGLAVPSTGMNVLQMQIDHPNRNSLVEQKIDDMSLVFSAP